VFLPPAWKFTLSTATGCSANNNAGDKCHLILLEQRKQYSVKKQYRHNVKDYIGNVETNGIQTPDGTIDQKGDIRHGTVIPGEAVACSVFIERTVWARLVKLSSSRFLR